MYCPYSITIVFVFCICILSIAFTLYIPYFALTYWVSMSSTLAAAIYSWAKPSQHSAHTICLPDPPIVKSSSPSTWKKHSFKNTVWKIQFGKVQVLCSKQCLLGTGILYTVLTMMWMICTCQALTQGALGERRYIVGCMRIADMYVLYTGCFFTGPPPKSSKYKKVNLG